jgi:hypothetical protein
MTGAVLNTSGRPRVFNTPTKEHGTRQLPVALVAGHRPHWTTLEHNLGLELGDCNFA